MNEQIKKMSDATLDAVELLKAEKVSEAIEKMSEVLEISKQASEKKEEVKEVKKSEDDSSKEEKIEKSVSLEVWESDMKDLVAQIKALSDEFSNQSTRIEKLEAMKAVSQQQIEKKEDEKVSVWA